MRTITLFPVSKILNRGIKSSGLHERNSVILIETAVLSLIEMIETAGSTVQQPSDSENRESHGNEGSDFTECSPFIFALSLL